MSTDAPGSAGPDRTVVLDIDGTLVDSAYLHVHAWSRAFHQVGLDVPSHRIHGAIGMGGDRIVAHLAGEAAEHSIGDDVRARHDELFESVLGDVRPTRGCTDLLQALRDRGLRLVVASSANASVTDALLEAAGASTYVAEAFMLGDAPWDGEAAAATSIPFVALRTGGFGDEVLREAGAAHVFEDPADLLEHLDEVLG